MRKLVLTAAALLLTASPVLAGTGSGRIACDNDVRDIIQWTDANRAAALQRVPALEDELRVLLAQCRASWGWAQANIAGLESRLGMESAPQVAYQANFAEWPNVYD